MFIDDPNGNRFIQTMVALMRGHLFLSPQIGCGFGDLDGFGSSFLLLDIHDIRADQLTNSINFQNTLGRPMAWLQHFWLSNSLCVFGDVSRLGLYQKANPTINPKNYNEICSFAEANLEWISWIIVVHFFVHVLFIQDWYIRDHQNTVESSKLSVFDNYCVVFFPTRYDRVRQTCLQRHELSVAVAFGYMYLKSSNTTRQSFLFHYIFVRYPFNHHFVLVKSTPVFIY